MNIFDMRNIMKLIKKQIKRLFCENEIYIRAAALTFYTLSGILPLCILCILLEEMLMLKINVSDMAEGILPDVNNSFDALCTFPQIRLDQIESSYGIIGNFGIGRIFVIAFVVLCVNFFLNNLHGAFNYIWKSEDRTQNFWKCLGFNLLEAISIFVIVLFSSVLYSFLNHHVSHSVLAIAMMTIMVYLAYRVIPSGKHPHRLPAILSAFSASICLFIWSSLFPSVGEQLAVFQLNGISLLLLIFWMYWSWFIILTCARLCAYWSKRGMDYMSEEVNEMAPIYRNHLMLLVASYIFKNAQGNANGAGLSIKDIRDGIRKRILKYLPEGTAKSDDSFLPMILLDSIINELVSKGIVKRPKNQIEPRFFPDYKAIGDEKNFTVGDFLFRLDFFGRYDLKHPYYCVAHEVDDVLATSFMKMYAGLNDKLIDIDLTSYSPSSVPSFEGRNVQYEKFKDSDMQRKMEAKYESAYMEELKHRTPNEVIKSIKSCPETAKFEPDKEYHIQLVQKLAARMQDDGQKTDISNVASKEESAESENFIKKIFRKLFARH